MRWKYLTKTGEWTVYVDYRREKTKIDGSRYFYIHDGIYPYHDPVGRKFRKKR